MKIQKAAEPKKHGINGFGNWILHDKEFVLPFLITCGKWLGPIVMLGLGILMYKFGEWKEVGVVFILISLFGFWGLYKFYKNGGSKNLKGMSTNEILWSNRFKLKK